MNRELLPFSNSPKSVAEQLIGTRLFPIKNTQLRAFRDHISAQPNLESSFNDLTQIPPIEILIAIVAEGNNALAELPESTLRLSIHRSAGIAIATREDLLALSSLGFDQMGDGRRGKLYTEIKALRRTQSRILERVSPGKPEVGF